MRILYVDDLREPTKWKNLDGQVDIARNYNQAINALRANKYNAIDLDHDLGETKTGYNVIIFMIENQINVEQFIIHTMNPVGRYNMIQIIEHYFPKSKLIVY